MLRSQRYSWTDWYGVLAILKLYTNASEGNRRQNAPNKFDFPMLCSSMHIQTPGILLQSILLLSPLRLRSVSTRLMSGLEVWNCWPMVFDTRFEGAE